MLKETPAKVLLVEQCIGALENPREHFTLLGNHCFTLVYESWKATFATVLIHNITNRIIAGRY